MYRCVEMSRWDVSRHLRRPIGSSLPLHIPPWHCKHGLHRLVRAGSEPAPTSFPYIFTNLALCPPNRMKYIPEDNLETFMRRGNS
jgi:hypothetical protein